ETIFPHYGKKAFDYGLLVYLLSMSSCLSTFPFVWVFVRHFWVLHQNQSDLRLFSHTMEKKHLIMDCLYTFSQCLHVYQPSHLSGCLYDISGCCTKTN